MADELRWCRAAGGGDSGALGWARMAALAPDGSVFVPAAVTGDETRAVLSATWDGVPLVASDGHTYLPTSWVAAEHPDLADWCGMVEGKVRAHFGDDSAT